MRSQTTAGYLFSAAVCTVHGQVVTQPLHRGRAQQKYTHLQLQQYASCLPTDIGNSSRASVQRTVVSAVADLPYVTPAWACSGVTSRCRPTASTSAVWRSTSQLPSSSAWAPCELFSCKGTEQSYMRRLSDAISTMRACRGKVEPLGVPCLHSNGLLYALVLNMAIAIEPKAC